MECIQSVTIYRSFTLRKKYASCENIVIIASKIYSAQKKKVNGPEGAKYFKRALIYT